MAERDACEVLQVSPRAHQLVIQAAFRVLASISHPDRDASAAAERRMIELNVAYGGPRTPDLRAAYDRQRAAAIPVAPEPAAQPAPSPRSETKQRTADTLDFGRYNGWTIAQLASRDPSYLRWLSRHSAGIRFRTRIAAALRGDARPSASEKIRGA